MTKELSLAELKDIVNYDRKAELDIEEVTKDIMLYINTENDILKSMIKHKYKMITKRDKYYASR